MRMPTIAFDLCHILIDSILAVITAVVRFWLRSAYAHIVLTFFACHIFLLELSSRSLDLDVDVFLLRSTHKSAAVEKYTCNDRYNNYQRKRPNDAATCAFTFCHFLFLPRFVLK